MSLGTLMGIMGGGGGGVQTVPPAVVQMSMSVVSFFESVRTGPTQCPHTDGETWKEKYGGRELSKAEQRLYDTALETMRLYLSGERNFGLEEILASPPPHRGDDEPRQRAMDPVG